MNSNDHWNYRRRLYSGPTVIGKWLRRRTVESLMRIGSPEAVYLLAEAAANIPDAQAQGELLAAFVPLQI